MGWSCAGLDGRAAAATGDVGGEGVILRAEGNTTLQSRPTSLGHFHSPARATHAKEKKRKEALIDRASPKFMFGRIPKVLIRFIALVERRSPRYCFLAAAARYVL